MFRKMLGMVSFFPRRCWRAFNHWVAVGVLFTLIFFAVKSHWNTNQRDQVETEFLTRQRRYMDACISVKTGYVKEVFVHEPSGLAVCHTPKAGCTFWKRILTYLNTKENEWENPFQIDRFSVHHRPSVPFTYQYTSKDVRHKISKLTRVVFGRDPYSRLWSTFVDKFILPDFWIVFGQHINKYRNLGNGSCLLHMTFEDFLLYALHKNVERHWAPLHTICNPCDFYPKYIGKMETFSRDTSYILNKSGLGYLLSNQDHDRHVEDEMSMIIDYHFKYHASRMCLTVTALVERLWRVFQLNGYISLSSTFPTINVNKFVEGHNLTKAKDAVTKVFIEHYRRNRRSSTEWKQQRHLVLVNAYKEIPLQLREDISEIYKHDFELFDYEQYPKYIFPERYSLNE